MAALGPIIALFRPLLAATVLALLVATASAAAEKETVRAGVHEGFGRLVFDWTSGVGHSASISNRTLNIRFDRPVQPIFQNVRGVLRAYIADIRLASDGQTVLATLKGNFGLKLAVIGTRLVIDLLRPRSPPATPKAGAQSGRAVAKPPVQLGPRPARVIGARRPPAAVKSGKPGNRPETVKVRTSLSSGLWPPCFRMAPQNRFCRRSAGPVRDHSL